MRYIIAILIFLLSAVSASAQITKYYVSLFDADHFEIIDNHGNLNISANNLHTIELESNSVIVDLKRELLLVITEELIFSYAPRGVMTSRVLNFDSRVELDIKLNSWKSLMVQEYSVNGDVYNTFYGKIKEHNKFVWKEVHKIKVK